MPSSKAGSRRFRILTCDVRSYSGEEYEQGYPPLLKLLAIPEGCIPHGTCVLGYPAEQYHRIPVRKPVDVTWG